MKLSVKNELVKLVDNFLSSDDWNHRKYTLCIDKFARGKYSIILHYDSVLFDEDLFALVDFARKYRLSCFLGKNCNMFMQ